MSCVHVLSPQLECNFSEDRDCDLICSLLYSHHLLKQCPAQVDEYVRNEWLVESGVTLVGGEGEGLRPMPTHSPLPPGPSDRSPRALQSIWRPPSFHGYSKGIHFSFTLQMCLECLISSSDYTWDNTCTPCSEQHYHKNQKLEATQLFMEEVEQISRMWFIHTMEYGSALKRGNSDTCYNAGKPWRDDEISQLQKDKYGMILLL